ncbi:MAG: ABC transporter transmembrane domain-containing protein, partial [Myxococcota bacterium]
MSVGSVTSQPPDVAGAVTHALRRLSYYVRRNRGYYLLCVATILGYNAGFVAVPILVGRVIAVGETGLGRDEIALRCMVLIGIVAFAALMRFLSRTLVFNAAREVEYEIRNDLFSHLQRLPQSFFFRWRTGDLMSRCVNDLNSVRLLLGVGLLNLVQTPLMFVAVLAAMFVINAKLALLVLAPYPAFLLIARAFGRALHTRNLDTQVALAELSNRVQEAMAGISVIKAYAMEPEQEKRFDRANQALYRRHLRLVRVNGAMPAITGMIPAVAMFVVLIVGGRMIGAGALTVAEFFIFAMYIYQLTFPTFIMGWVVALVQRGAAAIQRIDEILSVEPSIADRPDVEPIEALRGEIEFRGFSFGYDGAGSGA